MLPLRKKVKPCRTWLLIFFSASWCSSLRIFLVDLGLLLLFSIPLNLSNFWFWLWFLLQYEDIFGVYFTVHVKFHSFPSLLWFRSLAFCLTDMAYAHVIWKCKQTESGYTAEILPHLLLSMHFATMFNPKSLPR